MPTDGRRQPQQTDNSTRPEDGVQDVDQEPHFTDESGDEIEPQEAPR